MFLLKLRERLFLDVVRRRGTNIEHILYMYIYMNFYQHLGAQESMQLM